MDDQDHDPQEAAQDRDPQEAAQDQNLVSAAIYTLGILQFHPNAPIQNAQYASRLRQGCAFFGCNHVAAEESRFCSPFHGDISNSLGNGTLAYVVVDGYLDKVKEIDMKSILALLNKSDGINVGLPTVQDEAVFNSAPWDWFFINMRFLHREIKRDWVFFHSKSRPIFRQFLYGTSYLTWNRKNNSRHQYGDHHFTSSVSYLSYVTGTGDTHALQAMVKAWSLHEHIYNDQSVYCLRFALDLASDLCQTKKGKTDSVKIAPHASDSNKGKMASGSKRKHSDGNTASPSGQPRLSKYPTVHKSNSDGWTKNAKLEAVSIVGKLDQWEEGACLEKDQNLQLDTEDESDGDGQIGKANLEASSRESILGKLDYQQDEGICPDASEKDQKLQQGQLATDEEEAKSLNTKM